jgi:hypothetical protein
VLLNCSVRVAMFQPVDMLKKPVLQNWPVKMEGQTHSFNAYMLLLTLTNYVIVHCHLLRGHAWPFIEIFLSCNADGILFSFIGNI